MNNFTKKLIICALALAMALSTAACGKKVDPSVSSEASASVSSEAPVAAEPTEDEYKAELKKLYESITTESAAMQNIDLSDPVTAIEPLKAAVAKVAPLYDAMATIKAPASLAADHAVIVDGAKASSEILTLSVQILEAGTDAKTEDVTALQTKIGELTPKVTEFATTLSKLVG